MRIPTHTHTHTHFQVDVGKTRKHAEKNGWSEGRQACDGTTTKNTPTHTEARRKAEKTQNKYIRQSETTVGSFGNCALEPGGPAGSIPSKISSCRTGSSPRRTSSTPRRQLFVERPLSVSRSGKLDRARSRQYRGQILQENMRWN